MERENDLRQQAAMAYQLAAQAKMAEDRAYWFALAEQWEQLAAAEATKRDDNSQRS
jgi:hypothetical protein